MVFPPRWCPEAIDRSRSYVEAGADCFFVPGLLDLDALPSLCAASPLPVNAMAVPVGPTIPQLAAVGVRRVSVGSTLQQATYAAVVRGSAELLGTGTFDSFAGSLRKRDITSLLPARRSP